MKLNEYARAVHENAVAHGWYDDGIEFPEVAALIHSEISEALAEYREGNPLIYGCCGIPGAVCEFEGACDKPENERTCKPEGLAVELCDAIMRNFRLSRVYARRRGGGARGKARLQPRETVPAWREKGMINYFDAAEKTLRSRGALETALENLERRRERIIAQSGPAGYPSPDFSKPYASVGAVNDALSACLELAEVTREIERTEEAIGEIDRVIGQLEPEEREIIRLWYIERKSKEEIAGAVSYASTRSVYDLRNTAVARFALLYFGAAALPSV